MDEKELIDRKCNSCETKIEDEYHVTIECPRYEKWLHSIQNIF